MEQVLQKQLLMIPTPIFPDMRVDRLSVRGAEPLGVSYYFEHDRDSCEELGWFYALGLSGSRVPEANVERKN